MFTIKNRQLSYKILVLLIFCLSNFTVTAENISNAIYINIESGNNISLNATAQPLENILRELCKRANIELSLNGKLTQKTSLRIKKQPLSRVLKKMLANHSLVMIHSQQNTPAQIEKIIVYPSTDLNLQAFREPPFEDELRAIDALLELPEDEAIAALSEILSDHDKDTQIIQHAIRNLSLLPENAIENALATGLGDHRPEIRADIIIALATSHTPESARIIAQTLFADKEPGMRQLAIKKLASFDTPASKAFLQAAMQDSDESVRLEAQYALDSFVIETAY